MFEQNFISSHRHFSTMHSQDPKFGRFADTDNMRHPKSLSLLVLFFAFCNTLFAQQSISLVFPSSLLDTSITSLAIKDVQQLLTQACNCEVSLNNESADVLLKLPSI